MKRVTLILILATFSFSAAFAKLQLKLPTEITGEKPVTIFNNQLESNLNIQVPADVAPMMDKGMWLVGAVADLSLPLGDFSDGYNLGFSIHAMAGYLITKNILLSLGIGYATFSGKDDVFGNSDVSFSWIPLMFAANYLFNPGQKLMPFIGAALGLYFISSSYSYTYTIFGQTYSESVDASSTEFGIAPRIGVLYAMSATVLLTVMAEYNLIFTSGSSTSALGFLVGANFALK